MPKVDISDPAQAPNRLLLFVTSRFHAVENRGENGHDEEALLSVEGIDRVLRVLFASCSLVSRQPLLSDLRYASGRLSLFSAMQH